jgi:hypothetical protein
MQGRYSDSCAKMPQPMCDGPMPIAPSAYYRLGTLGKFMDDACSMAFELTEKFGVVRDESQPCKADKPETVDAILIEIEDRAARLVERLKAIKEAVGYPSETYR